MKLQNPLDRITARRLKAIVITAAVAFALVSARSLHAQSTPAAGDDLSGDSISVTGGVPGSAPSASSGNAPSSLPVTSVEPAAPNAPANAEAAAPPPASPPPVSGAVGGNAAAPQAPESEGIPIKAASAAPASGGVSAPPVEFVAPPTENVPAVAPPEPAIEPIVPEEASKPGKGGKPAGKGGGATKVASNEPDDSGPFGGLGLNKSKSPIKITADTMSLDYKGKSILWSGHVKAIQDTGQLTSNTLDVNYVDSDMKVIKDMIADGNVRISQGTRFATGDHAVMNQAQQTVVLTGSPVVHDGGDQITGKRITVFLKTNRSVVEGAHAVIFPHQNKAGDNSNPPPATKAGK